MLYLMLIVIWTAEGTIERFAPTPVDWHTCRLGELKQALGWRGQWHGGEIILAKCRRVPTLDSARCDEGICG